MFTTRQYIEVLWIIFALISNTSRSAQRNQRSNQHTGYIASIEGLPTTRVHLTSHDEVEQYQLFPDHRTSWVDVEWFVRSVNSERLLTEKDRRHFNSRKGWIVQESASAVGVDRSRLYQIKNADPWTASLIWRIPAQYYCLCREYNGGYH
eukprot:718270_1